MSLQWLVAPAFADDASQGASSGQSADPIVQAQWSALVDAASNAQNGADSSSGAPTNLNGGAGYDSSLLVPPPATRGVDIISESMKYHNSAMQHFNSQGNGGMQYGQVQNAQNNFNAYGMQNGMTSMSMNGMNSMNVMGGMNSMNGMNGMMSNGMSNNFVMPAGGNPMHNQMMQSQMMGNGCMHQGHCCGHGNGMNRGMMSNGSSDGLNTQAIGALGAATLMGVFMQKGGVGGILQDMGWDGSRHVRGSSIGGY